MSHRNKAKRRKPANFIIIDDPLPASPTRDQLMARLLATMQQQILPDAEMRAAGYSQRAIDLDKILGT